VRSKNRNKGEGKDYKTEETIHDVSWWKIRREREKGRIYVSKKHWNQIKGKKEEEREKGRVYAQKNVWIKVQCIFKHFEGSFEVLGRYYSGAIDSWLHPLKEVYQTWFLSAFL